MDSFINDGSIDYRSHHIDILHLSPPCQYFSPGLHPEREEQ